MNPHPAVSQALMTEFHSERTRVRRHRFRPSGGAAARKFRPLGHSRQVGGPASSAGCLNA